MAEKLGCEHYRRRCAFVTPCCKKIYTCRLCHDDKESHVINRKEVITIKCLKCEQEQQIQPECSNCKVEFSSYFCAVCRLFDDEDKKQFHCDGCGICRVGGRENFFHCDRCDLCLAVGMKDTHKCIEKASRSNCPVCMEYLHTSREPCHIPPCGHLIHGNCFKGMLNTGNYACPLCAESMVDMKGYWTSLAQEIDNTPMPEEYRDLKVMVLCRDCHKETKTRFHVCGLKCTACGSFNTARTAEHSNGTVEDAQNDNQPEEGATSAHNSTPTTVMSDGTTGTTTETSPGSATSLPVSGAQPDTQATENNEQIGGAASNR